MMFLIMLTALKTIDVYLYSINRDPLLTTLRNEVLYYFQDKNFYGTLFVRNHKYYIAVPKKLKKTVFTSKYFRPYRIYLIEKIKSHRIREAASKDYLFFENIFPLGNEYEFSGYYYRSILNYILLKEEENEK